MKDKILKAIDKGLKSSLIDFGNDKILKTSRVDNGCVFKKGDYVYYDDVIGYNNKHGDEVAICVNDEPGEELYLSMRYKTTMMSYETIWAWGRSHLYKLSKIPNIINIDDGWEVTLYIKNTFKYDNIKGTVWNDLEPNEYVPSLQELLTFLNTCPSDILDEIPKIGYMTSTLYVPSDRIIIVKFDDKHSYSYFKNADMLGYLPFYHIENKH